MKSVSRLLAFVAVAVVLSLVATVSGQNSTAASRKVAELLQLAKSSDQFTIEFDANSYKNFVVKSPRPYQLFVVYTANSQMCIDCPAVENALRRTAMSYYVSGDYMPSDGKQPVFFGIVDVSQSRELAEMHGLTTVPHVVSTEQKSFKKGANGQLQFRPRDMFQMTKKDVSVHDILQFVNQKSKRNVEVYKTFSEKLGNLVFLVFMLGTAGIVLYAGVSLVQKFPVLMIIGALLVQLISTSGIFFNLQHGMNLFGYDPNTRKMVTFAQNSRMQYLGEGLLMAGTAISAGLLMVGAVLLPSVEFVRKRGLATVFCILCAIGFFVLTSTEFDVYTWKSGWYAPFFWPPQDYIRGPLRIDRGNSF